MQTRCVRQGQVEIGIIEHEGREFSALGATVVGRHVTGYTRQINGDIELTTWCGQTMLACRSEIVEHYWSGTMALMFRLTGGRFIVGYSLGMGMLFRGELFIGNDADARSMARKVADQFAELDAEDEENLVEEEELLDIQYRCPECGHEWEEQWSSACDSECPNCGTKNITALSWTPA